MLTSYSIIKPEKADDEKKNGKKMYSPTISIIILPQWKAESVESGRGRREQLYKSSIIVRNIMHKIILISKGLNVNARSFGAKKKKEEAVTTEKYLWLQNYYVSILHSDIYSLHFIYTKTRMYIPSILI